MMEWIRGPVIGRGSTSAVSLSFAAASGEVLAVKSADLSRSAPLQKESELLSKLSSPHVVEYRGHEITEENGELTYNLFMEYMPRGTLCDEIQVRGGKLKEPEIRYITRKILFGLEYIHDNGLVHCDIKTQNILISDQGPKIADFGCAKLVEGGPGDEHAALAGTPAYMSPEVARCEEQGFAADVWSVGCVVIEMATGSRPWTEVDDPVSALYRIGYSGEAPEPPLWLTEEVKDFVRKCLTRDPRKRATVKDLLKHPFLLKRSGEVEAESESSTINDVADRDSPNGVLEPRLWESAESTETVGCSCSSRRAGGRMEELALVSGCADWSSEDGWITVRIHRDDETAVDCDGDGDLTEDDLIASEGELDSSESSVEDSPIVVSDDDDDGSDDRIKQIVMTDYRENDHSCTDLSSDKHDHDLDSREFGVLKISVFRAEGFLVAVRRNCAGD